LFQNGDYAYDIPEQYATPKVRTRYCRLSKDSDSRHVLRDNLCACCNKRESLKLSELSNFEPKSEKLFNTELKAFKEYLEARYPLCDSCKSTVRDVLRRQAVWLTSYKMLFFKQKPIKTLVGVSTFIKKTVVNKINARYPKRLLYCHKYLLTFALMSPSTCSCSNK